ncbi:endopeptidase O [Weissella oryzae SG25]|uniref:Endopeptidase O n=1 Tax=Weissella oryzae (strain DSM 25784 / JCM 18191 / LMG 30913 / SG25) TaxID=1329250 RepID=A0A069D0T0_WEIOS|nr:M13-type metalloendopeptidase [Weissella oryzae]GAK30936.1 endopeptidase O [Weissella oryzae SG25]
MNRKNENFYQAINANWASQAVIPDDKPRTGGFSDLADAIEDLMLTTTDQWQAGTLVNQDPYIENFIKLHKLASDYPKRNAEGVKPILPLIKRYQAYNSFADFAADMVELEQAALPNALPLGIAPDFKDARTNVLWAEGLGTILPDTSYYGTADGDALLEQWRESQRQILEHYELTAGEIADLLDKTLAFDARIATVVLSNEESSEYAKLYHPYQWDEFTALAPMLPFEEIVASLLGSTPDMIVVPEERFWQAAEEFYSEAAWPLLKAYLLVSVMTGFTSLLSDELRVLGGAYGRALSGTPVAMSSRKAAYYLAAGPYKQALGLWYAKQYFSSTAKEDVEAKVETMIDVYKQRLAATDWLAPETRQKAIVKLDAIVPHIGYPDKLPARYANKVINLELGLFDNIMQLRQKELAYHWSQWHQPVDRSEWHMAAHTVNAYYDPQQNQIVFPAAILQAPFYSLDQSSSANYGGIGAVIAHEISHAFDTNGASFDENGSLNNWWTEADYAAFKERTQLMVEQFDGQDSYGAKVNGKLTVSENVADLGGLAAALAAAKQDADFSAVAFFESWAKIWRMKARPEYMQLLAKSDVHGPAELRVNLQVQNFDDFFAAFDVKAGDGMWLAPEKRLQIW